MKSPFPGMDPFLERHWLDVQNRLVMLSSMTLNERLPPDLVASTDERVKVEGPDDVHDLFRPDVAVVGEAREFSDHNPASLSIGGVGVMPPGTVRIVALVEPVVERFVRIVDAASEQAITVIEFLSPTNKLGDGLKDYRQKRQALLDSGVNLVEIDLCRRGDWERLLRPHPCPAEKRSTYRSVTRVASERQAVYLLPIGLRQPLPELPIPLRPGDPEVKLPLQALIGRVFETGRYGTRLDYAVPLSPPLEGDDTPWAAELIRSAETPAK